MSEIDLIKGLQTKIEQIIELYNEKKQENAQLKSLLNEKEAGLELKNKEIEKLNEKLRNFELADAFVSSAQESKDAKLKINAIVREIDNCIALLNR